MQRYASYGAQLWCRSFPVIHEIWQMRVFVYAFRKQLRICLLSRNTDLAKDLGVHVEDHLWPSDVENITRD